VVSPSGVMRLRKDWCSSCFLANFQIFLVDTWACHSLKKLTRDQLQPVIDRIADQLPGWKADLLAKTRRKILVHFVLTGMLIYLAVAVDLPAWGWKAIDKMWRGFFWRGRKDVKGGHCQVAWGKVCRPLEFGGLRICSLKELGWALRMRWLWLEKTGPSRPWSAIPIQVPDKTQAFFAIAMQTKIGDGASTLFWRDRWLHGHRGADIAPRLLAAIPKRRINKCTVLEAPIEHKWISDIRGALTVRVIVDYLHLWNALHDVVLQPGVSDRHFWRFASNG
jgi:hypothetical protein